ncbi:MAG: DinB family protein [Gemmatimonadaceae bacterium]
MNEYLMRLFRHMAWADNHVIHGLRSAPGSDQEALTYFAHVIAAEHVWLSRIRREPTRLAVWPALSIDECAFYAAENMTGFESVIAGATPNDLHAALSYVNSAGQAFTTPLDDILLHVALHGAYHRGQVSLLVRRGGGVPAPTDYIAFVRGVPAATRADRPPS